jgi:hypothetical protein
MKNTPGCQLQNSNMLKNSYWTSMPNTHMEAWSPPDLNPLTPTSSDTHTPFKKTLFPIHSTPLHSSIHHLTLTTPQHNKPCTFQQLPHSLQHHDILHKNIIHLPFHSIPFILTSLTLTTLKQQNPCNSKTLPFTPILSNTHNNSWNYSTHFLQLQHSRSFTKRTTSI